MLECCWLFQVTVKQKMCCRLCSVVHVRGLSRRFCQTKIPLFCGDRLSLTIDMRVVVKINSVSNHNNASSNMMSPDVFLLLLKK